jgi:hypothetical protein
VTTTSHPKNYSTTSSDTITITSLDTIDFNSISTISSIDYTSPAYSYSNNYGTIITGATVGGVIPSLTTSQINSIAIDTSSFKINIPEEWVNCLPDFNRIEKMCEEYPGLKIAYEKFKTTYKLVADHYDTPKDKRPKP